MQTHPKPSLTQNLGTNPLSSSPSSDHPNGTASHVQSRANLPTAGLNPTILPHWPQHSISPYNNNVTQPMFTRKDFIEPTPQHIPPTFNQNQDFRPQQAFGGNMSRGFPQGGGFRGGGNFNGGHGAGSFGGGTRGSGGHR